MATLVRAKIVQGEKHWYLWSGSIYRELPECVGACRSDVYELLRRELGLPAATGRKEIVKLLWDKTWHEQTKQWIDDDALQSA